MFFDRFIRVLESDSKTREGIRLERLIEKLTSPPRLTGW